ncbi:vegetative cell wall protein gp1-like [Canna indica]|uniref:Vegetative cell wall protein gp1-like n=1 Tax=Canna indica TaxID=4628 RepID=A0AAQ3Q8L7_9LILI|nr:vegetative cell wall protein gp1-like [Canna indica]
MAPLILLVLALSPSLLFHATAVCVPRDTSKWMFYGAVAPPPSLTSPPLSQSPPQSNSSPSQPPPQPQSQTPPSQPPPQPQSQTPPPQTQSQTPPSQPPPQPQSQTPPPQTQSQTPPSQPPPPPQTQTPSSQPPPQTQSQTPPSQPPPPPQSQTPPSQTNSSSQPQQLPQMPLSLDFSFGDQQLGSLIDGVKSAVDGMCKETDYPEECLSSIVSLLPSVSGNMDATVLLKLQMDACRSKLNLAKKQLEALLQKPAVNARVSSSLQVCSDNYDDAFDNLDAAASAIGEKDKGRLNSMLSALLDDFGTCEDGFTEIDVSSPLQGADSLLSKVGSNLLAIAAQVKF